MKTPCPHKCKEDVLNKEGKTRLCLFHNAGLSCAPVRAYATFGSK